MGIQRLARLADQRQGGFIMKFENTKKALIPVILIGASPLAGVGLAQSYIKYGLIGGLVASFALAVVVMGGLGLYQDWKESKR